MSSSQVIWYETKVIGLRFTVCHTRAHTHIIVRIRFTLFRVGYPLLPISVEIIQKVHIENHLNHQMRFLLILISKCVSVYIYYKKKFIYCWMQINNKKLNKPLKSLLRWMAKLRWKVKWINSFKALFRWKAKEWHMTLIRWWWDGRLNERLL